MASLTAASLQSVAASVIVSHAVIGRPAPCGRTRVADILQKARTVQVFSCPASGPGGGLMDL